MKMRSLMVIAVLAMNETLSVSLNNHAVDFGTVTPGSTFAGSVPVQITTSWILRGSRNSVSVYAYFTDSADAMDNGLCAIPAECFKIPSSAIKGSTDTGATWNAFSNAIASGTVSGTGFTVSTTGISNANRNANKIDNLMLQLDLTAGFAQMAAGDYTGTMHIAAVATP